MRRVNIRRLGESHERLKDEHVVYLSRETADCVLPRAHKNSPTCLEDTARQVA